MHVEVVRVDTHEGIVGVDCSKCMSREMGGMEGSGGGLFMCSNTQNTKPLRVRELAQGNSQACVLNMWSCYHQFDPVATPTTTKTPEGPTRLLLHIFSPSMVTTE